MISKFLTQMTYVVITGRTLGGETLQSYIALSGEDDVDLTIRAVIGWWKRDAPIEPTVRVQVRTGDSIHEYPVTT